MTIQVGVIGCGVQGRKHIDAYERSAGAEVVAVCDLDPARVAEAREEFSISRGTTDANELISYEELDLISICTMPNTHADYAVAALQRDRHVMVEKPIAMNVAEVRDITAAAREARRLVHVGFNMRYLRESQYLRRCVEDGTIGRPVYVRAWTKAPEVPWWGRHYEKSVSAGGSLASTGVHVLDLSLWLLGQTRVASVSAEGHRLFPRKRGQSAPSEEAAEAFDVEDVLTAFLRFVDGTSMTLESGWMWDYPDLDYSLEILGENATARLSPLRVDRDDGVGSVPVEPPDDATAEPRMSSGIVPAWERSIREGVFHLIERVEEYDGHQEDLDDLVHLQEVVDAMYRSAETRTEVDVSSSG